MSAFPLGRAFALLIIRQQQSVDGLASRIVEAMRAMGIPEPADSDWRALREANYSLRRDGVLQLTPSGLSKTQSICLDLARQYAIHFVWHGRSIGNHGPYVRCTCGWNTYSANQKTAHLTLSRYAGMHLRHVREGTLPAAYRLPQLEATS